MNWLKNFVPPKLRKLVGAQKEIPENLWHNCPSCNQMIFHRDLAECQGVCQHCDYHLRMSGRDRLKMIFNNAKFTELEIQTSTIDPLKFRDLKKYPERIKAAQSKTGNIDALNVALGKIGRHNAVVSVFDFSFMGGSMGITVGNGILMGARRALAEQCPLIVITSSGGARMQEGVLSLMQLARTTIAVNQVKEAGLPYIVVLTDPTTGGVSASFAMLGDILIAEPGAIVGFAGQRVIEQTIRETLPEGFQKAEYLMKHGMIDMVIHRHRLRETLAKIIDLLVDPSNSVQPNNGKTPSTKKKYQKASSKNGRSS